MSKRITRKLTDVATEVEQHIRAHYNVSIEELAAWKKAASISGRDFPACSTTDINMLWIDYEVQRDVIYKHIINIMKKWDPRICSPVSACRLSDNDRIYTYDGQHRTIAATILGFTKVPCAIVVTNDKNFASDAFEKLNDTGVKRLTPGDLHRNALVRFKNGSKDIKNVMAYTMQCQFDQEGIDLQDKGSRASDTLRGDFNYFFSHFKYAQKSVEVDRTGKTLQGILNSIKGVFAQQDEIDQGVFIGLLELHRLIHTNPKAYNLPKDWMVVLLNSVKKSFESSHLVHSKAHDQWGYIRPGAGWTAPSVMSNFMRELHIRVGGTLDLPYHGDGSRVGIEENNIMPGLFPND